MSILGLSGRLLRFVLRAIYTLGGAAAVLVVFLALAELVLSLLPPSEPPANPSLSYTKQTLSRADDLLKHDVRLFIRPTVLQDYGSLYDGLKLGPNWFPFTLTGPDVSLSRPTIEADLGEIKGSAVVRALAISLQARLSMQFNRIDVKQHASPDDNDCDLIFVPHFERVEFTGVAQTFVQSFFPRITDLLETKLGNILDRKTNSQRDDGTFPIEIKLPIPRRIILPLGIAQEEDMPFRALKTKDSNDDPPIIGNLRLKTSLPETRIVRFFNYEYPLITANGIWLFANVQSDEPKWITLDDIRGAADKNDASQSADLANALRQLSKNAPASDNLELRLKTSALLGLVEQVKRLDVAHRTATISTVSSAGDAFRLQGRDDHLLILESIKLTADIPNSNAVHGQVILDGITGNSSGAGIELSGTAKAHAETSVRLFSDVLSLKQELIQIDVTGDAPPTSLKSHLRLFQQSATSDGVNYAGAYWGLDTDCTIVNASLVTKGGGKVGGLALPLKFDSLKVDLHQKLFVDKAKASLIVSPLPNRNPLVKKAENKESTKKPSDLSWSDKFLAQYRLPFYELVTPSAGVDIAIVPTSASASIDDYSLSANPKVSAAADKEFSEDEKKARSKILDALKDVRFPGKQTCPETVPVKILLEGLDFGPQGDLMKFLNETIKNEKAKIEFLVAIYEGKDAGPALKAVVTTEFNKLKIAVDASGKVIKATIDSAIKTATDLQNKVDDAVNKVPVVGEANKQVGDAKKKVGDAVGGTAGQVIRNIPTPSISNPFPH